MPTGGLARRGADGATAVGERTVLVTVTYLEMTAPDRRPPAPGWTEPVTVQRAERPPVSFYRYLYDTVGADWDWYARRRLSDDALAAIVHDDAVEVHVLYVRGVPAGYVELDRRVGDEVEIAYFGLMPDYIGRGLGPSLLGWALNLAWSYRPRRVWLHTCSLDHPGALTVYRRAGFEVYDREVVAVEAEVLESARRGPATEDAQVPPGH
ncbi:MAG: GNAT family N-acetyltransferase [Chromatiales bacterium]|nr:GNAT family N-acetyltransferase [Chromatiales bacterium]